MRKLMAGLLVVLVGLGAALAQEQLNQEAVQENARQWQELYNQGDFEALAELYAEDAVFYGFEGEVHEGREAILAYMNEPLPGSPENPQIEIFVDEVHPLSEDAFVDIGRYVISAQDGTEIIQGNYLGFSRLIDGEWRIYRHFANMALPAEMLGEQNSN